GQPYNPGRKRVENDEGHEDPHQRTAAKPQIDHGDAVPAASMAILDGETRPQPPLLLPKRRIAKMIPERSDGTCMLRSKEGARKKTAFRPSHRVQAGLPGGGPAGMSKALLPDLRNAAFGFKNRLADPTTFGPSRRRLKAAECATASVSRRPR